MSARYLVAIPVFNEQEHVARVLNRTLRYASNVVVIDDGSTDATPALLRQFSVIDVIHHDVNRGYGRTLADAFAYAGRRAYDWLITMDCDEQHEPATIPAFVQAMNRDDADIISGSRYLRAFNDNDLPPTDRRSINIEITRMINKRLGLILTDAFCGFKAYRVSSLAALRITQDGYAMPMQLWVQAACHGLRIRELPVRLVYNDPNRHFGGVLDNPTVRFRHYVDVFEAEMRAMKAAIGRSNEGVSSRRCGPAPPVNPTAANCISS